MRLCPSSVRSGRMNPPDHLIDPLVEKTDNHWYWLGEFRDDGLDRYATINWAPPSESTGSYVIVRLLWARQHQGEVPPRLVLGNACGLFTCINPSHWVEIVSNRKKKIALPKGCGARPCVLRHGNGKTVHIARDEDEFTICGLTKFARSLPISSVINCKDCIASWRSTNSPLIEAE